jgi:hypothetical protein
MMNTGVLCGLSYVWEEGKTAVLWRADGGCAEYD